jgi:hypothetical protein
MHRYQDESLGGRHTLIAPIKPSILEPAASTLYTSDQKAWYWSLPGRAKERARRVWVHSVRIGRMVARKLWEMVRGGIM